PNAHQSARVYLSRMLLDERVDDILPDWAFFVRAVVDSTGVSPTASRERLVEDAALEYTREQLGSCVRAWLMDMAVHQPHRFGAFLAVHEHAIKQLVLYDEQMATIFLGWLTVETSAGRMSLERLVKTSPTVRYASTLGEFRQVASLASKDSPLVNGGFVYDTELVQLLPVVYPSVVVTQVDVLAELDRLDPPDLGDRTGAVALEDRATAVLAPRQCQAVVRVIGTQDVPAMFVADPEVFRHIDRGRAAEAARSSGLWTQILAQVDAFALSRSAYAETGFTTRLCLNWANPLIRSLAACPDEAVFSRCVQLLYVQSQLAGSYPLTAGDRALMTTALSDLVALTTLSANLSAHGEGTDCAT
ncbi:MAG: HSP90 family protein, partial [Micrococcales bacterium]|nr:HSP90 family protein [Micrococcales bacterium]